MASKSASMHEGQAFKALIWPLRASLAIAVLGLIMWGYAIGVQVVQAQRSHEPSPAVSLDRLARDEIDRAAAVSLSPLRFSPAEVAVEAGNEVRDFVIHLIATTLRTIMNVPTWARTPSSVSDASPDPDPAATFMTEWWPQHGETVELVLRANYIFFARSTMFVCGLPLLALCYFVACVDGASARAIRRADGARESSNIYHRAKIGQLWVVSIAYMGYLAFPWSINPFWVVGPAAVTCAVLARTQIKYYKKYM